MFILTDLGKTLRNKTFYDESVYWTHTVLIILFSNKHCYFEISLKIFKEKVVILICNNFTVFTVCLIR